MFTRFRCFAVLIAAALPLAACTTPAERQLQKISVASEQLWAQYDACIFRVEGTSAYQRLNRAYILKRDDPRSVEKMAIDRLASDQDKADLLVNKKNTDRCNQELFKGFAEFNPGFNVLLARFMSEDDELDLRTVRDEVTVGARNQIVHQRYAKRLSDWNFAGQRIIRLYTWRLRRTCTIYCSSFSAASLLPTSAGGISNLAGVTPPPSADGQAAGLYDFQTSATPVTQEAGLGAGPAAPEGKTAAQAAPPKAAIAATPVAQEAKTAAQAPTQKTITAPAPTAQAPVTAAPPPPPKPVTATAPAAKKTATAAQPPAQETTAATAPAAEPPATAAQPASPKPVIAAAPAAQKTETAAEQSSRETAAAPVQAAQTAERSAESAKHAANSAPKPPTHEADTGLKPAAGPADEPKTTKMQQVQVASVPQKAKRSVYTVHLASMQSEVEARAEWGQLQASYPAILGDRVLFTREVRVEGKGTFVRVLTGLFHDRTQAKDLCGQLGGGDQYCAILRM